MAAWLFPHGFSTSFFLDAQLSQCSWLPTNVEKSANLSWLLAIQAEAQIHEGLSQVRGRPSWRRCWEILGPVLLQTPGTPAEPPSTGIQVLTKVTLRRAPPVYF